MRRFFEGLYFAITAFVGLVATVAFVSLGVLTAQTASAGAAWLVVGVLMLTNTMVALHHAATGQRLISWWPVIPPWTDSLLVRFAIILPMFAFICYLLLYAALVQINGTRPEWLEL